MPTETRIVAPSKQPGMVCAENGTLLKVPHGWELLPPGDAGMTRRVKSLGPSWTVKTKKGRRVISLGVWAPMDRIIAVRNSLNEERSTESYAKRQAAAAKRRQVTQTNYIEDFQQAVIEFLDFAEVHSEIAMQLAERVTTHATPVGSGTVARTKRIPIERRAESAVIAWMRHQTTAYDDMKIPRKKGARREVRQILAKESKRLLKDYRAGVAVDAHRCPLQLALKPKLPV